MEIIYPNKEFKVMIIDMLNELRRRMDEHSDKFNKELEYRKKNQTELKNMITEIKEIRIINSRLDDRNRSVKWQSSENIQTEQKKREFFKIAGSFQDFWNNLKKINIYIIEVPECEQEKLQRTYLKTY